MTRHRKEFDARILSVQLANECHQRDNEGKDATDSRYNGTIKQDTLTAVLANKTTVMNERLTFIGYLKTVIMLFKITFIHKKRDGDTPILRGFITQ